MNALEWVWRALALLALPVLAWVLQLSADITRAQVERADLTRRIEQVEERQGETQKTLSEIKTMLKELTVSARYMAADIKSLKDQKE